MRSLLFFFHGYEEYRVRKMRSLFYCFMNCVFTNVMILNLYACHIDLVGFILDILYFNLRLSLSTENTVTLLRSMRSEKSLKVKRG